MKIIFYPVVLTHKQHLIEGSILLENGANIIIPQRTAVGEVFYRKLPRVNHIVIEGEDLVEKVLLWLKQHEKINYGSIFVTYVANWNYKNDNKEKNILFEFLQK